MLTIFNVQKCAKLVVPLVFVVLLGFNSLPHVQYFLRGRPDHNMPRGFLNRKRLQHNMLCCVHDSEEMLHICYIVRTLLPVCTCDPVPCSPAHPMQPLSITSCMPLKPCKFLSVTFMDIRTESYIHTCMDAYMHAYILQTPCIYTRTCRYIHAHHTSLPLLSHMPT